jgi:Leucine-rich repeat (LRR) protein
MARYSYPSYVQKIIFSNSILYEFPSTIFDWFHQLQDIKADNCGMVKLSANTFGITKKQYLAQLVDVSLSFNLITTLDHQIFAGASKLQRLDLSHNQIKQIKETTFYGIAELQTLTLSYNKIERFEPQVFSELLALKTINLEHNSIVSIEADLFRNNHQLQYFTANNNQIVSFEMPEDILIEKINLNNNALEVFNFTKNQAKEIYLDSNQLEEIIITGDVVKLELYRNKISKINVEFPNKIKTLDLRGNNVTDISFLQKLPLLTSLDLGYNRDIDVKLSSFSFMPQLTLLRLDAVNMPTTKMEHGLFSHLASLVTLDLSGNSFKAINLNIFTGLNNLETLNLNSNNLESFEYEDVRNVLPSISKIGIASNKWNCSFLSAVFKKFNQLNISITTPTVGLVRNSTNINGIGCITDKNNSLVGLTNVTKIDTASVNLTEVTSTLNSIVDNMEKMQNFYADLQALTKEFQALTNKQLYMEKKFLTLETTVVNLQLKMHTFNTSSTPAVDSNNIQNLVETMNNITLQRQKLNNDILEHKIYEISYKVDNFAKQLEVMTMKLDVMAEKKTSLSAAASIQHESSGDSSHLSGLMIMNIILISMIVFFVAAKSFRFVKDSYFPTGLQHNGNNPRHEMNPIFGNTL